ncbi:hypothetical protein GCM10029964_049290 [Kibdelosporangium lantanae]
MDVGLGELADGVAHHVQVVAVPPQLYGPTKLNPARAYCPHAFITVARLINAIASNTGEPPR